LARLPSRALYFLGQRWELEGDATFTQVEPRANRGGNPSAQTGSKKVQINYYVGRLNYNIPFGAKPGNAIIISGGAGANRVDKHTDLVLSPALGLRTMISRSAGFRFDISSIISPNPASGTFKYPTLNNLNDGAAYLSNLQARVGLSFLLGNTSRYVAPPPAGAARAFGGGAFDAQRADLLRRRELRRGASGRPGHVGRRLRQEPPRRLRDHGGRRQHHRSALAAERLD
jgi:hypothetical protein